MLTKIKRRSLLLVLLAAWLGAAGCGSDDDEGAPIPADQAEVLLAQLEIVENRLNQGSVGACQDVFTHPESPNQPTVDGILTQIPQDVDPDVRSSLDQSFQRLWDLVDQECDERQPDEPAQPEPDPEPTQTETEEEPTETEPPEEEPTDPEETPLPPEGDGDNEGEVPPGNGNGNGLGNGVGNGGGIGPGAEAGSE
jgi:outer membrane biosynthesis protein TonB